MIKCCDNRKFTHRHEDKCCIGQIELTITVNQRLLTYTVKNIGTMNLCHDILICSKLFGKTRIENEYLSYKESVSVTKNMNDIKYPSQIEYEKASAFTCLHDDLYLASREAYLKFENGNVDPDYIDGGFVILNTHVVVNEYNGNLLAIFTINNSVFSESDCRDLQMVVPYNGPYRTIIKALSNTEDVKLQITPVGLKVNIPVIEVAKQRTFAIEIPNFSGGTVNFCFKINSPSNIIEYTDYVNFGLTR